VAFDPCHSQVSGTAEREHPQTCARSLHCTTQKQSIATQAPPHHKKNGGQVGALKCRSQVKTDQRTAIISKKAVGKRSCPLQGKLSTTYYMVTICLLYLQGAVLPTLPPRVPRGTAVFSELTFQCLSGNVAVLGCSPPLWRVPERPDRLFPTGSPLQCTELVTQATPEASLERLVPSVDILTAWKLLPNISGWTLHTVKKDYTIEFGSRPPRFMVVTITKSQLQSSTKLLYSVVL